MTAITHAYHKSIGKDGYHAVIMCPPTLNIQWCEEIEKLIPNAKIHLVQKTEQIIEYHKNWCLSGRQKPKVPTFFVFGFKTMCLTHALECNRVKGYVKNKDSKTITKRQANCCPDCGEQLLKQTKKSRQLLDENGVVFTEYEYKELTDSELRRPTTENIRCVKCGGIVFAPMVPTKRLSFNEWIREVADPLSVALKNGDRFTAKSILDSEGEKKRENWIKLGKKETMNKKGAVLYKLSSIEYISKQMKNFFDMAIVDEVHELKSGETSQGMAFGKLVAASKKTIAGTGTLLGGYASDVFHILFRLFPSLLLEMGYSHNSVTTWDKTYGNIQIIEYKDGGEKGYLKQSIGQSISDKPIIKKIPGISPTVFAKFLMQNTVNVRLLDVWENPVTLVDVPTILVNMNEEQKKIYQKMENQAQSAIDSYGHSRTAKGMLTMALMQAGIALPDNMTKFPRQTVRFFDNKEEQFEEVEIFDGEDHLPEDVITPKEEKLIELVRTEKSEKRPVIIYVTDTGTSNSDRDIQPRLKKILEEQAGVKVEILRSNQKGVKPNTRSKWLKKQILENGVDVVICSSLLVKVGLNLLFTPTVIFYQFSWSLFVLEQAAARAWRIGQTKECRIFYLAYEETYQEIMAYLIARKKKASAMLNGNASSDGLSAMLGDDGDLTTLLLKEIAKGRAVDGKDKNLLISNDERVQNVLGNIGKIVESVENDDNRTFDERVDVETSRIWSDTGSKEQFEELDLFSAFEQKPLKDKVEKDRTVNLEHIQRVEMDDVKLVVRKADKKSKVVEGQLAFDFDFE